MIAGTARTSAYGALVVGLAADAIRSDPGWQDGRDEDAAAVGAGLRLHARVWWITGLSAELYPVAGGLARGRLSRSTTSSGGFLKDDFAPMDPDNLLCMCEKWRHHDVGRLASGDLAEALGRITARTSVIAFSHDGLFPPEDCDADRRLIPGATLHVIESPWGHYAFEMTQDARDALDRHLRELLAG